MIKFILTLIQIAIGLYWAGAIARQNEKVDEFVASLERGYGAFNQRVKDVNIKNGLLFFRKLYGWILLATIPLFVFANKLFPQVKIVAQFLSCTFFISGLFWFSLKWCLDHKQTVAKFFPETGLTIITPMILATADHFFKTNFFQILSDPFNKLTPCATF